MAPELQQKGKLSDKVALTLPFGNSCQNITMIDAIWGSVFMDFMGSFAYTYE